MGWCVSMALFDTLAKLEVRAIFQLMISPQLTLAKEVFRCNIDSKCVFLIFGSFPPRFGVAGLLPFTNDMAPYGTLWAVLLVLAVGHS